jgi:hypothetical protein
MIEQAREADMMKTPPEPETSVDEFGMLSKTYPAGTITIARKPWQDKRKQTAGGRNKVTRGERAPDASS